MITPEGTARSALEAYMLSDQLEQPYMLKLVCDRPVWIGPSVTHMSIGMAKL